MNDKTMRSKKDIIGSINKFGVSFLNPFNKTNEMQHVVNHNEAVNDIQIKWIRYSLPK
jgi:hypothetical protein